MKSKENEKYIKAILKEENHKVIIGKYEQPYKKNIYGPTAWRGERPSSRVEYETTPFDKVEIGRLFYDISNEIFKRKDVEWLEISTKIQPSPVSFSTQIMIRVDLWEAE